MEEVKGAASWAAINQHKDQVRFALVAEEGIVV